MHLRTFLQTVYVPRRLLGRSRRTVAEHQSAINALASFLGREPKLADLQEDALLGLQAQRAESPATANKILRHLMALANYACRRGYLRQAPEVRPLREPQRIPRAFTVNQVGRLLKAASETPGQFGGFPARHYWPAVVQTFYWTGGRTTAIFSAHREDVDLAQGHLLLRAETQKQYADQHFRLHADCVAALATIWPPTTGLLFPHGRMQVIYEQFRAILCRAGLPHGPRDLFQRIRRTVYSYCRAAGIDAGAVLGHHSDLSAYYADPTITRTIGPADVMPRPRPR